MCGLWSNNAIGYSVKIYPEILFQQWCICTDPDISTDYDTGQIWNEILTFWWQQYRSEENVQKSFSIGNAKQIFSNWMSAHTR